MNSLVDFNDEIEMENCGAASSSGTCFFLKTSKSFDESLPNTLIRQLAKIDITNNRNPLSPIRLRPIQDDITPSPLILSKNSFQKKHQNQMNYFLIDLDNGYISCPNSEFGPDYNDEFDQSNTEIIRSDTLKSDRNRLYHLKKKAHRTLTTQNVIRNGISGEEEEEIIHINSLEDKAKKINSQDETENEDGFENNEDEEDSDEEDEDDDDGEFYLSKEENNNGHSFKQNYCSPSILKTMQQYI